jgi:predicted amidohydrolase YtcJ
MTRSTPDAPLLVTAGRIHTQSAASGHALLLHGGRVVEIGALSDLRARAPSAEIIDYGGATITPGLTDSHIHITEWAMARRAVDLSPAQSIDECLQLVRAHAARTSSGWVVGRGWNPHHWGGEYPTRAQLDAVIGDRPAAFQSHDMHALWVNSRALAVAGLDSGTADPADGRIVRDSNRAPTGMLLENATLLVARVIPAPSDAELTAAVLDAQCELHRYGITGIHSFPGLHLVVPRPFTVLQRLKRADQLRLRVLQHIPLDKLDAAIEVGLQSGFGDDWIRSGGVKMFLDGALGSRTAWLREPYENSTDTGVQMLPEREFRDTVRRAAAAGLASTVHAIGDAAVTLAFTVLTADWAQSGALPNRIEHVQCCPLDLCELAALNGIVCSMQPCHLISDWRAADRHWGAQRARWTYALRSLLQHGATLAFGSDAPVEPCDPRLGFYAATARMDQNEDPADGWYAQERITMSEVLNAYTLGPARVAGATGLQGVLAPGSYADFVVWAEDPLMTSGRALLDLGVRATFVDGQRVHQLD